MSPKMTSRLSSYFSKFSDRDVLIQNNLILIVAYLTGSIISAYVSAVYADSSHKFVLGIVRSFGGPYMFIGAFVCILIYHNAMLYSRLHNLKSSSDVR